jgi:ribosomal protein L11 methyltransferase
VRDPRPGEARQRPTLCFRIQAPQTEWDRLAGELFALGTLGFEERDEDSSLLAYFPRDPSATRQVLALADASRGVVVHAPLEVPDTDWGAAWRAGLEPRQIGPLWVRPSWCAPRGTPEIEIDPQQAFGSGEHATTRLALRLLLDALEPGDALLDVGTGSGILALGALRLGAGSALGVELDPVACRTARANARRNRLPLAVVCGDLAAVSARVRFDLVVANLLAAELMPWLDELASRARRALILSGYLAAERAPICDGLRSAGLVLVREEFEVQSGDRWGACLAVQSRALQSSSSWSRVSSNG